MRTYSPADALGLPTEFIPGTTFGQAIDADNFPFARTFRLGLGFRF